MCHSKSSFWVVSSPNPTVVAVAVCTETLTAVVVLESGLNCTMLIGVPASLYRIQLMP